MYIPQPDTKDKEEIFMIATISIKHLRIRLGRHKDNKTLLKDTEKN